MWPVRELRDLLPEDLSAYEDADFLELRCARCGWTATFAAAAAIEEIQHAAHAHVAECPGR